MAKNFGKKTINMKWLSPQQYAELVGKSRQWVYLQVQLGRLKSRKVKKVEVMEVAYEAVDEKI